MSCLSVFPRTTIAIHAASRRRECNQNNTNYSYPSLLCLLCRYQNIVQQSLRRCVHRPFWNNGWSSVEWRRFPQLYCLWGIQEASASVEYVLQVGPSLCDRAIRAAKNMVMKRTWRTRWAPKLGTLDSVATMACSRYSLDRIISRGKSTHSYRYPRLRSR